MKGQEPRYWPTRIQLYVSEDGEGFSQWVDAVREHQEACRDVIDLWDDWRLGPSITRPRLLASAIERLRFTTTQLRQWQVGP